MSYKKALELIEKEKQEKTGELNLSKCNLRKIPMEIFEMTWLEELNLSNNSYDYTYDSFKINYSTEGSHLDNIISEIPAEFGALTNLKRLYIAGNLHGNKWSIKNIDFLSKLNKLQFLALHDTIIEDLSPLSNHIELLTLDISSTKISDLTPIVNLHKLRTLILAYTPIKNLDTVSNYKDLNILIAIDTYIENLDFLCKAKKLRVLNISGTLISDLTPISELNNLEILYVDNTSIEDLNAIRYLTRLKVISISNTNVSDLEPLSLLIQKGIPIFPEAFPYFVTEKNKYGLIIENCIITNPPLEIVKQGNEAILRYFAEKQKGAQKLMEAKLLIVGQGGAGKTSLKKKLHDINAEMPAKGDSTRGIIVSQLDCKTNNDEDFRLNIWDFGGQNVQHYAHQFFLTGSSLYALVTNEREQNPNFQYWLNIIEMLGGKSPVLIVQNEIAGHSEPIKNAAAIRERFGNVVNPFQQVDLSKASTDGRFKNLKEAIIHHALQLPHIGKEYPNSYVRVREALEREAKEKHYITWKDYQELCRTAQVDDPDVMQDIATTFTILGVCLHFKDDMVLKKFVFLNPKWIIDALFQLIYHEKVIEQKGKFSELDAEGIWAHPDYEGMEDKLIRIMENFELCYRMKDSKNYIVPQRLPAEDESYGWNEPRATKVQYAYKFMPKGLITRLTCRLHEKIEGENVWNDAVIFAMPKARAFVREVYAEERIAIEVSGEKRGDLLNRILDEVDDIHRKSNFANLQVEKLVPCSCVVCSEAKTPHFFDYDYLIELLDDGEYDERCKESKKKVDIREVLLKTGIDFKKHSRRGDGRIGRWGDLGDLERRGLGEVAEILIKKLNFLRAERAEASDAAQIFTLDRQIEEVEKHLAEIRGSA